MLRQVSIRDVVLIDRLELEFEPGLGVLTGETGAGKSILLDSLGLALGMRADTGLVRAGEAQASVAAEFELPGDHPVFGLLAEQGIEQDDGEPLIVRRTLKANGGSRAFAGGCPCCGPAPVGRLHTISLNATELLVPSMMSANRRWLNRPNSPRVKVPLFTAWTWSPTLTT